MKKGGKEKNGEYEQVCQNWIGIYVKESGNGCNLSVLELI